MKFDYVIGNPPYQDETTGDNATFAPPVYDKFLAESYKISDCVMMIHPARFLFNAGRTPKKWNEQMLNDPHFKVLHYEPLSNKVFANTEIKGGIVISYRNKMIDFGSIEVFTPYPELNEIMYKAAPKKENQSLTVAIYNQNKFNLDKLYEDYPEYKLIIGSDGRDKRFRNNIFDKIGAFTDEKVNDDDMRVVGVIKNKRSWRYIQRKYVEEEHENIKCWKVLISSASGTGAFGETLSQTIVIPPYEGYTQTYIGVGAVTSKAEALSIEKYLKTKFCRVLLSILKITQHITPSSFRYIPLQDFTAHSDIDWRKSVAEIDQQLYRKYDLTADEIEFIETHVKEMA